MSTDRLGSSGQACNLDWRSVDRRLASESLYVSIHLYHPLCNTLLTLNLEGPILLGYGRDQRSGNAQTASTTWKSLPRHSDEDQVRLDVDRAFVYYPRGLSLVLPERGTD